MSRKGNSKFEECEFVGDGEEDIRDILKRQFARYVNEEKGYSYLAVKDEVSNKGDG